MVRVAPARGSAADHNGTVRADRKTVRAGVSVAALLVAACFIASPSTLFAQTLNDSLSSTVDKKKQQKAKLLVEAKTLVYDNDKNTVAASGDANLYYQNRTLQADRVTYDRNTRRVFADGNVRIVDEKGTVTTGTRFELTDDFKDGFIDSVRLEQKSIIQGKETTTHFNAARGERTDGEVTTFDKGTYTACDACKDDPARPPLWQVKAAKIIHNNTERMVYYEDASLEFLGVPIAFVPYFSTPDPTVRRQTGFLPPRYIASRALGFGASVPFFWNIAPNLDLTVTPTFLTRQGVLGQAEFRHRLMNGSYNIRAAGIFQQDKDAFLPSPFGAREKETRGSIESTGKFFINEKWNYGWDVAFLSDKWFLNNYKVKSESLQSMFFRESISTAFLNGQGDRSWFDLRGYYFKPLSYTDWQKQQAIAHPVFDYNRRWDGPGIIGGEVALDVNFTSLTRDATQYANLPLPLIGLVRVPNTLVPGGGEIPLFDTCTTFSRAGCLVRAIAGTTNRLSTSVTWRRSFTDPLGQVWIPFGGARIDAISFQPDYTNYANAQLNNFLPSATTSGSGNADLYARAMPTVGVEYRYPFVAASSFGTHLIEPIGQVVARTNEGRIGRLPNDDSQSLIFDDTTIFEWNKFSGYDRVEGGVRANVGAQYTFTANNGAYGNVLVGQSYHLAGVNSFSRGDLANTGLESGLDTRRSDYVARVQVVPTSNLSFVTRARFDEANFELKRLESQASVTLGPVQASVTYARYAAQPSLGQFWRREGVSASAKFNLNKNWYVDGGVLLDLDRYLQNRYVFSQATPGTYKYDGRYATLASLNVGAGYTDECTTFAIQYSSSFKDLANGTKQPEQAVLLRLELRTLGAVNYRQQISTVPVQDGLSSVTSANPLLK